MEYVEVQDSKKEVEQAFLSLVSLYANRRISEICLTCRNAIMYAVQDSMDDLLKRDSQDGKKT
jgi:hypothetical protein